MEALPPVVLVHGAWHGGWCWTPVMAELAALGIASVPVDLAGHGLRGRSPSARWARPFDPVAYAAETSPVRDVTVATAAAGLIEQVRRIGRGQPCRLVAHSMGGVVATAAAEKAPELFAAIVYAAALAPVAGRPTHAYLMRPEFAPPVRTPVVGHPADIGAGRLDTGDPAVRDALRELFYHDVDKAVADAALALLSPDNPLSMSTDMISVTPERFGSIPHAYVICTADHAIPPALQRRFVTEIDDVSTSRTEVVELDSGHSPFLSSPAEFAGIIADLRPPW